MKFPLAVGTMLAAMVSVAANIYFSSNGPETYADGTPALTGECVALVWQRNGTTFKGFTADGWVVGPEGAGTDCVLIGFYDDIVADEDWGSYIEMNPSPIQLNAPDPDPSGRGYKDYFANGKFSFYILDTRYVANGVVTNGFDAAKQERVTYLNSTDVNPARVFVGLPHQINAWQPFNDLTNLTWTSTTLVRPEEPLCGDTKLDPAYDPSEWMFIGTCAATASAVPTNCLTAAVASLRVADGVATVTVTNTASYLSYNIATSNDVQALAAKTVFAKGDFGAVEAQQGAAAAADALTWQIPVAGETGFFKVVRQPIK